MTKTKTSSRRKPRPNDDGASASSRGKKRKREVQVVVCPSAFPDFATVGGSTSRRRAQERGALAPGGGKGPAPAGIKGDAPLELDVQETIREVHRFGAEGFTGAQKKSHQHAEYERITGRTQKRHKMPTKIVVGMRRKAMKREEREKRELKESGVVSHHSAAASSSQKKRRKAKAEDEQGGGARGVFGSNHARNKGDRRSMDRRSFGPAPDVGFMQKGMLRVKRPGR